MADKKQLGTQYLNTATVKKNIEEVNAMLKNLGKGVDLDLTKIVNAKVNTQLSNLKRQIQEIGQATSQASKVSTSELKEATRLLKEQIQLEAKLATTSGQNARSELRNQIQARRDAYNQLSESAREAAQTTAQVAKAQDQLNLAQAKAQDRNKNQRAENSLLKERLALYKQMAKEQERFASMVGNQIVTRVGSVILSELKNQWSAMVDYATQYYDTLNEIRVVTGMTENQANNIGKQYRQLAKEMKVTSTELASAAVTFYRQGQNDTQVNNRLNWVTKYAKVANISFETAAEQITASANAMSADIQGDIERVVDVFLYLGDAAATSGEEIGVAMQKASASATEFGLSFEWLGAYIATVAEQTRQAPQTIGNAFNSMMARLHSIKQNGFNEEDETKINDVAKALANVNIALMDSDGNWRDMSDIFTDISKQWGTMTDKQKSYIATTLAGTRQQNVFFALMNDMSKGIEGGSRAWELYTGALESAGTATEKFAVWQESVAASQENLQRAWEDLYSVLSGNVIKGYYNFAAGFVDLLAKGTQGAHGLNLALIPLIATITSIVLAFRKAGNAATFFKGIADGLKNHPLIAGIGIAVVAITALTAAFGAFQPDVQKFADAAQAMQEANEQINKYADLQSALQGRFVELASRTDLTASEQEEYNNLLQEFAGVSAGAKSAVDDFTSGMSDQYQMAAKVNEELEKQIAHYETLRVAATNEWLANYTGVGADKRKLTMSDVFGDYSAVVRTDEAYASDLMKYFYDSYVNSTGAKVYESGLLRNSGFTDFAAKITGKTEEQGYMATMHDMLEQAHRQSTDNAGVTDWSRMASLFFSEIDAYEIAAMEQVETVVQKALSTQDTSKLNAKQLATLNDYLMKAVLSSSTDEYADPFSLEAWEEEHAAETVLANMSKAMQYVVSPEYYKDQQTETTRRIYGYRQQQDETWDQYQSRWQSELENIAHDPELADAWLDFYATLFSSGLGVVANRRILRDQDTMSFEDQIFGGFQSAVLNAVDKAGSEHGFNDIVQDITSTWNQDEALDIDAGIGILQFMALGNSMEELIDIAHNSEGLEDFKKRLNGIVEESTNVQDSIDKDIDYVKEITSALSEVDKVTSILDDLHEGKAIKLTDLLGLAEAHPELLAVMDDMEELESALNDLVDSDNENVSSLLRGWAANNEATAQRSPFVEALTESVTTLEQLRAVASSRGDLELLAEIDEYLDRIVHNAMEASHEMEKTNWKMGIMDSFAEIEKLDSLIDNLNDDQGIDMEDLLGFADTNPELLAQVGNLEAQKNALIELRAVQKEKTKDELMYAIWSQPEFLETSAFADIAQQFGLSTLLELRDWLATEYDDDGSALASLNAEVETLADNLLAAANGAEEQETALSALGNVQKQYERNEKIRQAIEDIDPTSKNYSPGKAAQAYEYLNSQYVLLKNFDRSTEEGRLQYLAEATKMLEIETEQINAEAEAQGIVSEATAEAARKNQEYVESLQELRDEIEKSLELNRAQQEGYATQFEVIDSALQSGGLEAAVEAWKSISPDIQAAIQKDYPQLVKILTDAELKTGDLANETAALQKELSSGKFNASTRYFTNTAKAIQSLTKYETTAADAMATFNSEAENAVKAQAEYREASMKLSKGTEVAAEDVQNLATFLGFITPDALLDSWDQVGPMLSAALAEGEEAQNRLNEAAFINITGTSSADFSDIMNGLIMVEDEANAAVQALLATGQWTLEEMELPAEAKIWVPNGRGTGGRWTTTTAAGKYTILKPSGSNPFKGGGSTTSKKSSGGGGGGGGGGNKQNSGPSEVEIMLDRMAQVQSLQNHTRSLYSAQAGYYSQTGELQGVIRYYEKEIDAIKEQNSTLEANVSELETWIEKKKAEVNSLDKSTEEYSTAADELKQLQDRHQEYTTQQINNRTEMDKLTKSIKDQKDAIRNMEIDLRNTILQAIEDREELNDRMLQGLINVENTILELIQKRYEKERDLILKNSQEQIDALQKERDLLEEQLQMRKEQAEQEEKAAKLAELEAKYARISADPTRRKEMLSIEKQINELRDEMAWDLAESEVKAQQDAIDEQITSIEDYMAYIEDYYEDLFEHPKKLIEEMKEIIKGTDEEIIEWLKKNSDDFADHTEATQTDIVNGWQSMLDDMRGAITTYWDEVEAIIALGDEAIIEFLKNNSADYRAAGRLQAEAYVDEWQKKLDDLRAAYRQVTSDIQSYNYSVIDKPTGNSSSSGGGSGGSGGSSGKKTDTATLAGLVSGVVGGAVASAASFVSSGIGNTLPSIASQLPAISSSGSGSSVSNRVQKPTLELLKYDSGGTAEFTGPAWLDGKPGRPERVLSPYQTELFEIMVKSLETITRISIPSMPSFGNDVFDRGEGVSVGDIIVNVDKMDSDADYEAMAEKVFDVLMERLNRGSVVGGIRQTR